MYVFRRITMVMIGFVLSLGVLRAEEAAVEEPVEEEVLVEEVPAAEEAPAAEKPVETAAPAEEETAAPASTPGEMYSVQKGDTLWDLAGRYYQDPFQWGRIWEANRDAIRNPHLIYPDQKFAIPGGSGPSPAVRAPAAEPEAEEAAAPEAAPAVEAPAEETPSEAVTEAPAPVEAAPAETVTEAPAVEAVEAAPEAPPAEPVAEAALPEEPAESYDEPVAPTAPPKKRAPRYIPTDLGSDNLMVDENWEADGYIIRDEFKKLMIAQNDVVYLNVGAVAGAKPYMRGGIYRRGGKIKDPDTREGLGFIMRRIGTFQLTENVGDRSATAVVTSSKEPIRVGDIVRLENN